MNFKKGLISICFLVILLGIPYAIFLNKLIKVKQEIPFIERQEYDKNELEKSYWIEKINSEFNLFPTDSKNNFKYKGNQLREIRDTLITYFIYRKKLPINTFKKCFFECAYYDKINEKKIQNFSIVNLTQKEKKNIPDYKSKYFYLKLEEDIINNYNITKQEFRELFVLALGNTPDLDVQIYIKELKTNKDIECLSCYDDYISTYTINHNVISDFKDFIGEYMKAKKEIENKNILIEKEYKSKYYTLTSGMSNEIKKLFKKNIESQKIETIYPEYFYFYGSKDGDGMGDIKYSFEKKSINISLLNNLVEDVYEEYYANNSLSHGATPYSYCYGGNPSCSPSYGYSTCSYIKVTAPTNADVVVLIKKENRVYSHGYIKAGRSYTFYLNDGTYQPFFYYGNGWNPNKHIKFAYCGSIKGGFINDETLGKDNPIPLYAESMTYTLQLTTFGNFTQKSTDKKEAF